MESTTTIEDLVDDVLVKIFLYLTVKEIVRVQKVCVRWKNVLQDPRIWQHLTYTPTSWEDGTEVANTLLQVPMLRYLVLENFSVRFSIENALLKSGSELRKLVFPSKQKFRHMFIRNLLHVTSKLEHLVLPGRLRYSLEECKLIGKLEHLKALKICSVITYYADLPINLKPIIEGCPLLEHVDFGRYVCDFDELKMLLEAKKEKLHTLGFRCLSSDGKCTLSLLSLQFPLKSLRVSKSCKFINQDDFLCISKFKNLRELTLDHLETVDTRLVHDLFINFKLCSLTHLYISSYMHYEDAIARVICSNCPNLKSLSFLKCAHMTNQSFQLLGSLKNLESLHILCPTITDSVMKYIVRCRRLKTLHLQSCRRITSHGLRFILELSELEVLKLTLSNLEGLPCNLFPTKLQKLRLLEVYHSKNKEYVGLEKLQKDMPRLVIQF